MKRRFSKKHLKNSKSTKKGGRLCTFLIPHKKREKKEKNDAGCSLLRLVVVVVPFVLLLASSESERRIERWEEDKDYDGNNNDE